MKTLDRNVLILFDQVLTNEFIRLSRVISDRFESKIELNHENQIPHLTLYTSNYPEKNIEKAADAISKIAVSSHKFNLHFNAKSYHASSVTIFIDSDLPGELYDLHIDLLDALNPLREGYFNPDDLKVFEKEDKIKQNLINYGMWAVKEDYVPHVSIARFALPNTIGEKALSLLPEKIDFHAVISEIALGVRGENGICKEILQKFPLGG